MSLFPLADLIPNICSTLSHKDIMALFVIDHKTSAQLRGLTHIKHTTVIKGDCEFGITETITASTIFNTAVSVYVMHSAILHAIHTFQYHDPNCVVNINGLDQEDMRDTRTYRILHLKNNIVSHFMIILLYESTVVGAAIFSNVNMHYIDLVAICLTASVSRIIDIFTIDQDLCDQFYRVIGYRYIPSKENDAKLLRIFEQI